MDSVFDEALAPAGSAKETGKAKLKVYYVADQARRAKEEAARAEAQRKIDEEKRLADEAAAKAIQEAEQARARQVEAQLAAAQAKGKAAQKEAQERLDRENKALEDAKAAQMAQESARKAANEVLLPFPSHPQAPALSSSSGATKSATNARPIVTYDPASVDLLKAPEKFIKRELRVAVLKAAITTGELDLGDHGWVKIIPDVDIKAKGR